MHGSDVRHESLQAVNVQPTTYLDPILLFGKLATAFGMVPLIPRYFAYPSTSRCRTTWVLCFDSVITAWYLCLDWATTVPRLSSE